MRPVVVVAVVAFVVVVFVFVLVCCQNEIFFTRVNLRISIRPVVVVVIVVAFLVVGFVFFFVFVGPIEILFTRCNL